MPLEHGKSKKAFAHNVRTEMHHDHPLKQSLAIAYAMKRKAKKMAYGGRFGESSGDVLETTKGSLPGSSAKYGQGALARSGKKHSDIGKKYGDSIHSEMGREATKEAKEVAAHKAYEIHSQNPKLKGLAHGGMIHDEELDSGYLPMPEEHEAYNHAAMEEDERRLNQHGAHEVGPMGTYAKGGFIGSHQSDDHEMDMVGRIMKAREMCYSEGGKVANEDHGYHDERLAGFDQNEFDDLSMHDDLESSYTGANSGDEDGNEYGSDHNDVVARIMLKRRKQHNPVPA